MEFQTSTLMRARHMLETQGRFPGGALPSDISDSWLRSMSSGIDPLASPDRFMLTNMDMRITEERHASLIRFAKPELELLFDQVAGSNFMVALGSPEGVVLETLVDTQFAESEAGRFVVRGSIWTEELRGTNALGMCLSTKRVAQVYGGEHFLRAHADVACISAPIFDGRGGLAGILDASSRSTVRQQHTAALVQMSASNIENCLLRSANDNRIVLQFHPRPEYLGTLSVGMLVMNEDFSIHAINRRGEVFLAGTNSLIGTKFDSVFEQRFEDVALGLVKGETLRLRDRMGSAVSARCVANKASFALAMQLAQSTMPEFLTIAGGSKRDRPFSVDRNLFRDVVIEDESLVAQLRLLPEAAQRNTPIHIHGEVGTGKEVIGRLAHAASRREGEFFRVDARLLDGPSAEKQFFGDVGGQDSLLVKSATGTLLIDEVASLPLTVQAVLTRVIDAGEFQHPTDGKLYKVSPLLVTLSTDRAVTNENLLSALKYRIEGFVVSLPALRNRTDLGQIALRLARSKREDAQFARGVAARLLQYDWPGNLHELRSVVSRAVMAAEGTVIHTHDFDAVLPLVARVDHLGTACDFCVGVPWKESRCLTIRGVVAKADTIADAARVLGMSRTTIYKHIEKSQ